MESRSPPEPREVATGDRRHGACGSRSPDQLHGLSGGGKADEVEGVTERGNNWELKDVVDFEQALAGNPAMGAELRARVADAARGLDGTEARRAGLRAWLAGQRRGAAGRRFVAALGFVEGCLGLAAWLAGMVAVLGMWDRERGGVNVILFLAVLIGLQWLLLVVALLGWKFGKRTAEGFTGVQMAVGRIARKMTGEPEAAWWRGLADAGPKSRAAIGWRLARISQAAGLAFNIGILGGLLGLVLVRNVGFFWETTAEGAMRPALETGARWLSLPWAAWWQGAVPDGAVIDATRLTPGSPAKLDAGPAAWWQFLLMAVLFWGLLPRGLWWFLAWRAERKALATLDFQGRHHRSLWRDLVGAERIHTEEKPLDGVLVLDVGGSGLAPETLRPFLLRNLRVNPAVWKSTAVLDPGAEEESAQALSLAPAGVVLLAEGWALSPPRMTALHERVRSTTGAATPLKFLVANVSQDSQPVPATDEERREWERFVDGLKDPAAEVFFYQEPP